MHVVLLNRESSSIPLSVGERKCKYATHALKWISDRFLFANCGVAYSVVAMQNMQCRYIESFALIKSQIIFLWSNILSSITYFCQFSYHNELVKNWKIGKLVLYNRKTLCYTILNLRKKFVSISNFKLKKSVLIRRSAKDKWICYAFL